MYIGCLLVYLVKHLSKASPLMFHCFVTWYMKEVTLTESGHKPEIKLRIYVLLLPCSVAGWTQFQALSLKCCAGHLCTLTSSVSPNS